MIKAGLRRHAAAEFSADRRAAGDAMAASRISEVGETGHLNARIKGMVDCVAVHVDLDAVVAGAQQTLTWPMSKAPAAAGGPSQQTGDGIVPHRLKSPLLDAWAHAP
jgi:hypothetical protein